MIDDLDPAKAPAPPADHLRRQLARSRAFLRDHRAGLPPASAAEAAIVTVLSGAPPRPAVSAAAAGGRVAYLGARCDVGRWATMTVWVVLALDVMAAAWMIWTINGLDRPDLFAAIALTVFAGVTAMVWERRRRRTEHEHRTARLRADVWPSSAVPNRVLMLILTFVGVISLFVLAVLVAITGVLTAVGAAGVASQAVLATALMSAAVTPIITRMTTTLFALPADPDGCLDRAGAASPVSLPGVVVTPPPTMTALWTGRVPARPVVADMHTQVGSTDGEWRSLPMQWLAPAESCAACLPSSRCGCGRTTGARVRRRPAGVLINRRRARPDRVRSQRLRPLAGRPARCSASARHTRHRSDARRQRRQGVDQSVVAVLLQG